MTRWPTSATPGVQPYNDAVRAALEGVLEEIVALADGDMSTFNLTARELLEEAHQLAGGDVPLTAVALDRAQRVHEILEPHTTPEFDVEDLTFELLELVGDDASDDDFND